MKYFIDANFHEYKKKPLFNKPIDTVELISIGIVSEEYKLPRENMEQKEIRLGNKEYYAICKDFDLKAAWNNEWLRENVLKNLFNNSVYAKYKEINTFKEFKNLINHFGKTKQQISKEIIEFTSEYREKKLDIIPVVGVNPKQIHIDSTPIEFYAYNADNWVVFCWLFGRMADLPTEFPMYCTDLKQELNKKDWFWLNRPLGCVSGLRHIGSGKLAGSLKHHVNYPAQINEHNALADARWNKELYEFLNKL